MPQRSLKTKLVTVLLCLSVIPLLISSALLYKQSISSLDKLMEDNIQQAKGVSAYYFEQKSNEALYIGRRYADNPQLITALKGKNREELNRQILPVYKMLEKEKGLSVFEFGDQSGRVVTRAHNPKKFGDDKSGSKDIQAALAGKEMKGFSFGKSGLAVRAYVPVKDGKEIIGTFQVGFGFTENMLKDIRHSISGNISLYEKDQLALTTDKEQALKIGESLQDQTISDQVLSGKEVKRIVGSEMRLYQPLYSPLGDQVQGIIQLSQDLTPILKMKQDLLIKTIMIIIGTIIAAVITSLYLANGIARPISKVVKRLQSVAKGDLSGEKMAAKSKDEVGLLVDAANQTTGHLREMVQEVSRAAEEVTRRSEELTQAANEVKEGSGQVASTMEDLAGGADSQANEAAALTKAMDDFMVKIEQANEAGDHVSLSSNEVLKMTKNGQHLMEIAIEQMESIETIMKDSVDKVQGFGKQSEQVTKLVDVVQDIAQQTNLLALNAEIEAARAGEHGKGFAVVADEVRKLAEQVSKSVTEITAIAAAIQNDAKEMAESLENGYLQAEEGSNHIQVTGETFMQIHDAVTSMVDKVGRMLRRLASMTENSKGMDTSIEMIASISEESAAGAEQTSASVQQTATSMEEVAENARSLSILAEELNHQVSKFKWD
ncbi:methyl-accepting chemotaxis protein [Bacillus xiapuensis]|uniref:methyl-accepting chemotaxis protein n=1 Tax=Bacillus xiapuensis TaxID=2014075 RepID=UPI000C24D27B|nr:methyl-accepting chemotaxis protein [Bacillus xiapuensis]